MFMGGVAQWAKRDEDAQNPFKIVTTVVALFFIGLTMMFCHSAHVTFKVDRRHDWEQDEGNITGYQQGFPIRGSSGGSGGSSGSLGYNSMLDHNRSGGGKTVGEVGTTKVERKENTSRWNVFGGGQ